MFNEKVDLFKTTLNEFKQQKDKKMSRFKKEEVFTIHESSAQNRAYYAQKMRKVNLRGDSSFAVELGLLSLSIFSNILKNEENRKLLSVSTVQEVADLCTLCLKVNFQNIVMIAMKVITQILNDFKVKFTHEDVLI